MTGSVPEFSLPPWARIAASLCSLAGRYDK